MLMIIMFVFREGGAAWSNDEMIFKAIASGDVNQVHLAIEAGADLNMTTQDDMAMSALHFAVDRGLQSMCEILLSRGANVNGRDAVGSTPLMYAVACDHLVSFLLFTCDVCD